MVFGFLIVRLVRLFSSLPAPARRGFARVQESSRAPFRAVNYLGSCGGALVFNRNRMGWLCDRTIAGLVARLHREPELSLGRGMPFPTSWDPYFSAFMTLEEVYRYPVLNYDHHRAQLTLRAAP
jgi:hypothetical protein